MSNVNRKAKPIASANGPEKLTPTGKVSTAVEPAPKRAQARKRGVIDWERIEADYRLDTMTNVELCKKHNLNPVVLSKRIRKDQEKRAGSWQRDLSARVRRASAAMLLEEQTKRTLAAGSEAAAVMQMAALTRDVILGHRGDITRARRVWNALLAELEATTVDPGKLTAMLEAAAAGLDEAAAAAMRAQLGNLLQLHQRVGSIHRLADAAGKLHTNERKAFGIAEDDGGANPLDTMSEHQLEAEIARLESAREGGAL